MSDQSQNEYRWLSFSLRTFIVGVCLIAVVLSVLARRWHRYQQQAKAIESYSEVDFYDGTPLPCSKYLLTGEELADDVRGITITSRLSFKHVRALNLFKRLECLTVAGPTLDLKPLAGMTHLKVLNLPETKVADLQPVAGMTHLKELDVSGTTVTDLAPLANLWQLEELWLGATEVTDLTPLEGHPQLRELYLQYTKVTDLTPLADLAQLQVLSLCGTDVTDLTPLKNLTDVRIYVDYSDRLTIPGELQGRVHGIIE